MASSASRSASSASSSSPARGAGAGDARPPRRRQRGQAQLVGQEQDRLRQVERGVRGIGGDVDTRRGTELELVRCAAPLASGPKTSAMRPPPASAARAARPARAASQAAGCGWPEVPTTSVQPRDRLAQRRRVHARRPARPRRRTPARAPRRRPVGASDQARATADPCSSSARQAAATFAAAPGRTSTTSTRAEVHGRRAV